MWITVELVWITLLKICAQPHNPTASELMLLSDGRMHSYYPQKLSPSAQILNASSARRRREALLELIHGFGKRGIIADIFRNLGLGMEHRAVVAAAEIPPDFLQ